MVFCVKNKPDCQKKQLFLKLGRPVYYELYGRWEMDKIEIVQYLNIDSLIEIKEQNFDIKKSIVFILFYKSMFF